jgi:hypothetical protein
MTIITIRPVASGGDENARLRSRLPRMEWSRAVQPRRFKPAVSLGDHLADEVQRLREQAAIVSHGAERDELLRRAQQTEIAIHVNEWLTSRGLQPPT